MLDLRSKEISGKEIRYFINDEGANIELVKIEPGIFSWWGSCTINLYVNIYNDEFDKKISFVVRNFDTGISGESWFEEEEEDEEGYKEPTEEDSWAMTLDYFDIEDSYDAWDKDFWNIFGKYNEQLESCPRALFDSMANDEEVMKWCWCGHSGDKGGLFERKFINDIGEDYYIWEGAYTDEEERFLEMPVYIGENASGTERRLEGSFMIDTMFDEAYLSKEMPWKILNNHNDKYDELNLFMGEWLVNLWGCARKGRLIGDYCLGGYDLPDWEGDSTLNLLRFWKLTEIKQNVQIGPRTYTMFYSGAKCWVIDDEKADEEKDFYPIFFSDNHEQPTSYVEIQGEVHLPDDKKECIVFSVELTSIESGIIEHYKEYSMDMKYFPKELYSKLVVHLQLAYLDKVKDSLGAINTIDGLVASDCQYYFPEIEE